jgi:hypothetical protein
MSRKKDKKGFNKEAQYTAVYFPHNMIEAKDEFLFGLEDIDCNISKIVRELMPDIVKNIKKIKDAGQTYRHYNWKVTTSKKPKGQV